MPSPIPAAFDPQNGKLTAAQSELLREVAATDYGFAFIRGQAMRTADVLCRYRLFRRSRGRGYAVEVTPSGREWLSTNPEPSSDSESEASR